MMIEISNEKGRVKAFPDDSWNAFFNDTQVHFILKYIFKNIDINNSYPSREDIFRVFEMPIDKIRVVILGQDPYSHGEAVGLAFAIRENIHKTASLRIIEREVGHELSNNLKEWTDQGVFLLNTALTVEKNKSGSHTKLWKPFIEQVIQYIAYKNPSIWLLWGREAKSFEKNISLYKNNTIFRAAHPASESYRPNSGFIGCNHFKKVNSLLINNTINF